jgi:hypothetical protein
MPENGNGNVVKWSLDKRVPVALIGTIFGTIFLQSMTAVWWASAITARVDGQNQRIEILERLAATSQTYGVSIARLEEKINTLHEKINSVQETSREIRSTVERTDTNNPAQSRSRR